MSPERETIKRLVMAGYSIAAISARTDMPYGRVWEQIKFMRFTGELERRDRGVSLPTLSILNTDADIDPADLKAGLSAAREAGLS